MSKTLASVVLSLLITAAFMVAADSLFTGTWKLNVEKSKFDPGPPTQSETVTIQPDGKVSVEEVNGAGQSESWSYTPSEGTPATITGLPDSTVVEKKVGDRNIEHTWKMGESNMTGHGVLSKDGKKMTYTLRGKNGKGQPIHNVLIFEKQ